MNNNQKSSFFSFPIMILLIFFGFYYLRHNASSDTQQSVNEAAHKLVDIKENVEHYAFNSAIDGRLGGDEPTKASQFIATKPLSEDVVQYEVQQNAKTTDENNQINDIDVGRISQHIREQIALIKNLK